MPLVLQDIEFNFGGFVVPRIKRASDAKLSKMDEALTKAGFTIDWSNIDDLACLSVAFGGRYNTLTNEQKNDVLNVLNRLFELP